MTEHVKRKAGKALFNRGKFQEEFFLLNVGMHVFLGGFCLEHITLGDLITIQAIRCCVKG